MPNRSIRQIFNMRIPITQRLTVALAILLLGVLFHRYVLSYNVDSRSILLLPLLALPYTIQAFAILLTRAVLGCAIVTVVALAFFTCDLAHLREWLIVGKEAANH
jgi:hypothetical protein